MDKLIQNITSDPPDQETLELMLNGACAREPAGGSILCNRIILAGAYGCERCDDTEHPLIAHRERYMLVRELAIGPDIDVQVHRYFDLVVALDFLM